MARLETLKCKQLKDTDDDLRGQGELRSENSNYADDQGLTDGDYTQSLNDGKYFQARFKTVWRETRFHLNLLNVVS